MFKKIIEWFRGKKVTPLLGNFALIERTGTSKMKGIDDDFNKVVAHYVDGEKIKEEIYSLPVVMAYKKDMPVIDEENFIDEDDDFEWNEPTEFGVVEE